MIKKTKLFCICLSVSFLFTACATNSNEVSSATDATIPSTTEMSEIQTSTVPSDTSTIEGMEPVQSQVQIYEGNYIDNHYVQYNADGPNLDSPHIYCEIIVSNITNTSFDFSVISKTWETEEVETIIPLSTANFIGDGTEANFNNDELNLNFIFTNEDNPLPTIKFMEVTGYELLEDIIFINNSISGQEAG